MAHILVIDDDTEILQFTKSILENRNHRVFTSPSPIEGQNLILKHFPDIVLLDINMPGKDGMTVLKSIKNTMEKNIMAVIMMTGVTDANAVQEAKRLGVNGYIVKPIKSKLLAEKIDMIFSKLEQKNLNLIAQNQSTTIVQRKPKYTIVNFEGPVAPSSLRDLQSHLNGTIKTHLENNPVLIDIRNQFQLNKDQIVLTGKAIQLLGKNSAYLIAGKNYGIFSQIDIVEDDKIFIQFEDVERTLQIL